MFVSLAKKYNKPNALNEAFESRLRDIDKNDYLALTTLYLQVFIPTRAHSAGKLLTNYKGKEAQYAEIAMSDINYKIVALEDILDFKTRMLPYKIMLYGFIMISIGLLVWTFVLSK